MHALHQLATLGAYIQTRIIDSSRSGSTGLVM
jgi:hypothetical protein